jgi:hypothetical protein
MKTAAEYRALNREPPYDYLTSLGLNALGAAPLRGRLAREYQHQSFNCPKLLVCGRAQESLFGDLKDKQHDYRRQHVSPPTRIAANTYRRQHVEPDSR